MLAILFQEKAKKMLVFPKNAEKNASIIEKGLLRFSSLIKIDTSGPAVIGETCCSVPLPSGIKLIKEK